MRHTCIAAIRGASLVALLVLALTPCVARGDDNSAQASLEQQDTQLVLTDTPSAESSTSTTGEKADDPSQSDESAGDVTESETADEQDANTAADEQHKQDGLTVDESSQVSNGATNDEDGAAQGEAEEDAANPSDETNASAAEFYAQFHGNSWRFANGTPLALYDGESVTWTNSNGVYVGSNGYRISGTSGMGIDVSSWQGDIDWAKVKASGVEFAILRCGHGLGEDAQFQKNVQGCKANGIPFGVYFYSYAWDTDSAFEEAQWVLQVLAKAGVSPSDLSLPLYFDMENTDDSGQPAGIDANGEYHSIASSALGDIAYAFCTTVKNAGYTPGVYANLNWWKTYLTSPVFDAWSRWVAQWNSSCSYDGKYDYWQCSSAGSIPGISGAVDINFAYTDAERVWATTESRMDGVQVKNSNKYEISWSPITGASGYMVYRKTENGSWGRIGTTESTTYVDTTMKAGVNYYYTVRAYRGSKTEALAHTYDSRYWTRFDPVGAEALYLKAPKLNQTSTSSSGVKVSWSGVTGASGYAVYRKQSGGDWAMQDTTTSTSWTDKKASAGKTYYYDPTRRPTSTTAAGGAASTPRASPACSSACPGSPRP